MTKQSAMKFLSSRGQDKKTDMTKNTPVGGKRKTTKKKQKTHFYENLMNQNHSQAIEINYSMIQNLSKEKTFQKEGKKQPLSNDLAWNKKVWPKNY